MQMISNTDASSWWHGSATNNPYLLKLRLMTTSNGSLEWQPEVHAGSENLFVSATPANKRANVIDGVYFFPELSLKVKLHKGLFEGPRQLLRVQYETCLLTEKAIRCEISSFVNRKCISINNTLMCQAPDFLECDVPFLQSQLNLNEDASGDLVSTIELKVVRNKIGIKSVSLYLES